MSPKLDTLTKTALFNASNLIRYLFSHKTKCVFLAKLRNTVSARKIDIDI